MLYIHSLTAPEQRTLRHMQRHATAQFVRRARIVLLSADGWSVPAIAEFIHSCRRTVRKWLHAWLSQGLAGLLGKPVGRPSQASSPSSHSATSLPVSQPLRLVPALELTVPEIRRLLNRVVWPQEPSTERAFHWSAYRRYKQALAKQSHYRKRGAAPPPFLQLRL